MTAALDSPVSFADALFSAVATRDEDALMTCCFMIAEAVFNIRDAASFIVQSNVAEKSDAERYRATLSPRARIKAHLRLPRD